VGFRAVAFDALDLNKFGDRVDLGLPPTPILAAISAAYRQPSSGRSEFVFEVRVRLAGLSMRSQVPTCQPSWAFDIYSREGKVALARFLQTDARFAKWICQWVKPARRIAFLGHIIFRFECYMKI